MSNDAIETLRERANAGDFEAWEALIGIARDTDDLDLYDDLIREQMFGDHTTPETFARLAAVLVRDGERDMAVELTGEVCMMHGEALVEGAVACLGADDEAATSAVEAGLARFRRARDHGRR